MEIKYERDVDHCPVSPYVKFVTIKTVEPADNSDNLDKITFEEMGWNAISQKGLHHVGKKVMFIPPESVLPYELGEKLNVTKYLAKGRVKVVRFRGNRSEGLIVPLDIVEPYIPYIMKWEDKPVFTSAFGKVQQNGAADISPDFIVFYKMPNILNEPKTFRVGEVVYWSEKIHGTNFRFGQLCHPNGEQYITNVGSHKICVRENESNIYWKMYNKYFKDKEFPADITFFGEIHGIGIQDLTYNTQPTVKLFAAARKGNYIPIPEFKQLCGCFDLPCVKFHKITFESIEQLREIADQPSEVAENHLREGAVFVSAEFPERMAKCISFNYLTRKGNKKTERH